jgi:hypothetical protein
LNRIRVGIDMTSYRRVVCGLASTSIFTTWRRSACSVAMSSRIGAIVWQGPHQAAVKSTRTGRSADRTTSSKVLSLSSVTLAMPCATRIDSCLFHLPAPSPGD